MDDADQDPVEPLYHTHRRAVLAYTLRRSAQPIDAEDAAAETFLVAWRRLADAPAQPDVLLPWLYAIARRVLANQRRGADRRARLSLRLRQLPTTVEAPPPGNLEGPAIAALSRLRPDDQELLRLVAWEELTHAQIAVVLGVTPNAVAIRLHRARARFEVELANVDEDGVKGFGPGRTSTGVKGRMFRRVRTERTE